MRRSIFHTMLFFMLTSLLLSCIEEYELKTESFERLLVVEATITDEFKFQEIKLSKTIELNSFTPNQISNAQVQVEASNGANYNFAQTEPGLYTSVEAFKAQPNESYTLKVTLSDGKTYVSTSEFLPPAADLESLETNLMTVDGEAGVAIVANSSNNSSGATYFKYDYKETYKIVAPYYSDTKLILINVNIFMTPPYYELLAAERDSLVSTCYSTKFLGEILQTSLSDSENNSVVDFPVRFIKNDDSILRERYSILVTQYIQSVEAYNFYKTLKELGTVENIFTDSQPGFIQGNMVSQSDAEENVIGFFQVSSVSSERIYFNYSDIGIPIPPYFYECDVTENLNYNYPDDYVLIYEYLTSGNFTHYVGYFPEYKLVKKPCSDCTLFSTTERPAFWED